MIRYGERHIGLGGKTYKCHTTALVQTKVHIAERLEMENKKSEEKEQTCSTGDGQGSGTGKENWNDGSSINAGMNSIFCKSLIRLWTMDARLA